MKQISSATAPMPGRSSLSQAPLWPCWLNLNSVGWDRQLFAWRSSSSAVGHAHRRRQFLAAPRFQARLVVEQIGVRGRAGLGQINHPLGPWPQSAGTPPARPPAAWRSPGPSSEAKAAAPMPVPPRPKNSRRVKANWLSANKSIRERARSYTGCLAKGKRRDYRLSRWGH